MTDRVLHATFNWRGGTHRFALPMGGAFMTSGANGGPPQLWAEHGVMDPHARLRRLLLGLSTVDDVAQTIRGGLIGGGQFRRKVADVEKLVRDHVLLRPLAESTPLAKAILLVALFGVSPEVADTPVDASAVADAATADHLSALQGVE